VNPDVDGHTQIRNHPKTLRKTQKNNLLKTKRMINTKIQARWGPGFYTKLASGAVSTPAPRQLRHLSGAFQTQTVTSYFAWFTRNNRYNSASAGRSQRALLISIQ